MRKLTQLELYGFNLMGASKMVHFKNVTKLIIQLDDVKKALLSVPLSFSKLEELRLLGVERSGIAAIKFITKMKDLVKLDYKPTRGYGDIDDDLDEIGANLSKLMDVTINDYGDTFTIGALKQFVSNCAALQKVCIRFLYEDDVKQNQLMEEINNILSDWNVEKNARNCKIHGDGYNLYLTRKE